MKPSVDTDRRLPSDKPLQSLTTILPPMITIQTQSTPALALSPL